MSNGNTTHVAEMRTSAGAIVGTVSLHEGASTLVDMRLPGWQALLRGYSASSRARYWLELDSRNGHQTRVALDPVGDGSWHVESTAVEVASVAMVDAHGRVWCRARIT
jgi:hypothetical protein